MQRNEAEWLRYASFFKEEKIKAKTTLLAEGHISNRAFFIEKGAVRLWFNNAGNDVTFQFFFEGESVSSIESFRSGKASLYSIESIENCIIRSISKEHLLEVIEKSPLIKQEMEDSIFNRLINYQHLFLSRIKDNPETRYNDLLANHPKILQRVPQHYIASYLGITAVSLSRIRNRK